MTLDEIAARYPQLVNGNIIPPDATRYFLAADRIPVSRPFHLRWLLPHLLGTNRRAWWCCWGVSWLLLAVGMFLWRTGAGDGWERATAATALVCGLSGLAGTTAVNPVGVDLPATALGVCVAAFLTGSNPGWITAAILLSLTAGSIKETAPVWIALVAWSPIPLIGLLAPAIRALLVKPGPDPLGPKFQFIADHPIRAALQAHSGRWRDGWLMVAPWGICLAALVSPSWPLIVLLAAAYGQLLVGTDTVRLVHHAAGPAMAAAAASIIPVQWLLLAVVAHVVWWRTPERV